VFRTSAFAEGWASLLGEIMMKFHRRKFLHLAANASALTAVPSIVWALDYPARPIHIVVGFPAGAPADIIARLFSQSLSERLGQGVVVDNRPGSAGNIGAQYVVNAPADGYTLLLITSAYATNPSLYRNPKYNLIRDIAPIAGINSGPFIMVVRPEFPAKSVAQFIAYAKANPGKINMASTGIGSPGHVLGALFEMLTGVELVHVPYTGNYISDLLGGQVQVAFSPPQSVAGYIQSGKFRALAVTTKSRSELLPTVPTVGETVPGYEGGGWIGIGAPRNTPASIVEKLGLETDAIVADISFDKQLANYLSVPMRMNRVQFAKFIADETEKWAKVIKFAGILPV
jgi:tripartite-type tricarboxylate transporter receptor subunit TctC